MPGMVLVARLPAQNVGEIFDGVRVRCLCAQRHAESIGASLVASSLGAVRQSRNQPGLSHASEPNSPLADIVGVVCRGRLTERAAGRHALASCARRRGGVRSVAWLGRCWSSS
jgi:hypothetical protein